MMVTQFITSIKQNGLFKDLDNSLNVISGIESEVITLKGGEVVFRDGDSADSIYLVLNGEINLLKKKDVKKIDSQVLVINDFFGQEEFFRNINRASTAVALRETYLLKLNRETVKKLMQTHKAVYENLWRSVNEHDNEYWNQLEELIWNAKIQNTAKEEITPGIQIYNIKQDEKKEPVKEKIGRPKETNLTKPEKIMITHSGTIRVFKEKINDIISSVTVLKDFDKNFVNEITEKDKAIETLERQQAELNELIMQYESKFTEQDITITRQINQLKELNEIIIKLKGKEVENYDEIKKLQKYVKDLDEKEKNYLHYQNLSMQTFDNQNQELGKLRKIVRDYEIKLQDYEGKIAEQKIILNRLQEAASVVQNGESKKDEIINYKNKEITDLKHLITELENNELKLKAKMQLHFKKIALAEAKADEYETKLNKKAEEITSLNNRIELLQNEQAEILHDGEEQIEFGRKIKELEVKLNISSREKNDLKTELERTITEFNEFKAEYRKRISNKDKEMNLLNDSLEKVSRNSGQDKIAQQKIEEQNILLTKLNKEIENLKEDKKRLQEESTSFKNEANEYRKILNEKIDIIDDLNHKINNLSQSLELLLNADENAETNGKDYPNTKVSEPEIEETNKIETGSDIFEDKANNFIENEQENVIKEVALMVEKETKEPEFTKEVVNNREEGPVIILRTEDRLHYEYGDITVIEILLERATLQKAGEVKDYLTKIIKEGARKVIVEFSKCEFIDSTYLGALVAILKRLVFLDGDLKLVFYDETPLGIFHVTNMDKIFKLYKSKEEAMESFDITD